MNEFYNKIKMVKEMETGILIGCPHVSEVKYEVFVNKEKGYVQEEFLIIIFKGGAMMARNCYGNSCSAIIEEIGSKINGGYYTHEREDYANALSDENLERLVVED